MEVIILITTYKNKSRQLRYFVNEILKKGLALSINTLDYAKSYTLVEGKIQKNQEKFLMIKTTAEKKQKLEELMKNRYNYEPSDIKYLKEDMFL